jgi:hypothetical protein
MYQMTKGNRADRHLELIRRGIGDVKRRTLILDAEDKLAERAGVSVFKLLKEDDAQRGKLSAGPCAFRPEELTLLRPVEGGR